MRNFLVKQRDLSANTSQKGYPNGTSISSEGIVKFSKVVDGCKSYSFVLNKQLENHVYTTDFVQMFCAPLRHL